MCENIEITKEEMWSKRFEDFNGLLDELDNMQLAYIIRRMTKYIDQDKKCVWIMSESVETRLLNAMCFPEIVIVDGKISYLLGYPVMCETFLSVENNRDSAEEYGEVIAYPYIWLGKSEIKTRATEITNDEKEFLNQSYVQIDKDLDIIRRRMEKTLDMYIKIFDPSKKQVVEFAKKINAHVNQTL